MDISKQVASLEQAKRLKELGVRQESHFWWKCNNEQEVVICGCSKEWNERHFHFNTWYAAPSVAELGVMLSCVPPNWGVSNKLKPKDISEMYNAKWMAKAVIYLLENDLITAQSVNDRLG